MEKVTWFHLSANINAIHLLEQNLGKIDWYQLSSNINAIDFMEKNLKKIDWSLLSENINALISTQNLPTKNLRTKYLILLLYD